MLTADEMRGIRDMFSVHECGTCVVTVAGYSWLEPIYSNMSGKALQTLHRASEPCPFCNHHHRDRRHRCANCGAPEGEMP